MAAAYSSYLSRCSTTTRGSLDLAADFMAHKYTLGFLSQQVYEEYQPPQMLIHVPGSGCSPRTAHLLAFRAASSSHPLQYGIWEVENVGIVVAFCGTATYADIVKDIRLKPHKLHGTESMRVHGGAYKEASKHASQVFDIIEMHNEGAHPVWLTGHSIGGGYANCLMIHIIDAAMREAKHGCRELSTMQSIFVKGGGTCTFGAPLVLNCRSDQVSLDKLEAKGKFVAENKIELHNFVNTRDLVPRLLGICLTKCLRVAVPKAAQNVAKLILEGPTKAWMEIRRAVRSYQPFGQYHFMCLDDIKPLPTDKVWGKGAGGVSQHHSMACYLGGMEAHLKLSVGTCKKELYLARNSPFWVGDQDPTNFKSDFKLPIENWEVSLDGNLGASGKTFIEAACLHQKPTLPSAMTA